ncbi:hypothetical protein I7I51_07563 [Histoplasma capsulatum]|uniref:Uncharacterized protein n=1 Tax=Ajellomyces capsulatus TaxID=5037 RepID=A0A8A1LY43_AJECA|nr:hypothetical protein I7I51_07563 [Histoplasma capsulatum]
MATKATSFCVIGGYSHYIWLRISVFCLAKPELRIKAPPELCKRDVHPWIDGVENASGDGWLEIGDRNERKYHHGTNYDDSSRLAISRIITIFCSKLLLIPGVLDDLLHCGSPELQEYQFQHEAAELPQFVIHVQY